MAIAPPDMSPPLDIFEVDHTGDARWRGWAGDTGTAMMRLKGLGLVTPGKYILFSQKTGNRQIFQVDENGEVRDVTEPAPD